MPPKVKITPEMVIEAGFEIVRETVLRSLSFIVSELLRR